MVRWKLLTSIMFKSSYSTKYLPTVNYLTSLDKYSLFSLVFIYMCLVWYGVCASLYGAYPSRTVYSIDKIVFALLLIFYFIVHVVFILWLRSAYLIRNTMVDRDEEFWRDEHEKKKHSSAASNENNGAKSSFLVGQTGQSHNQPISPTLINNLESQKPTSSLSNLSNLTRPVVNMNKRESVFNTINNIDKIGYFQNRHQRKSLTENMRFFLYNSSKPSRARTSDSSSNFAQVNLNFDAWLLLNLFMKKKIN